MKHALILAGDGNPIGTGAADGVIRMQIRSLEWQDGWPHVEIDQE